MRASSAASPPGVRVAVDDSGIGDSSLSPLRRLPIDTLQVLLAGCARTDDETVIPPAVNFPGRRLPLHIVAAGVETEAGMETPRIGGKGLQVYPIFRPMRLPAQKGGLGRTAGHRLMPVCTGLVPLPLPDVGSLTGWSMKSVHWDSGKKLA